MKNQEIAKIFFNIASLLDSGQRDFRPIAYKRAALALAALEEDVAEIYLDNGLDGLEGIPAIGKNLALKIEEYIKTGRINEYEKLRKALPVDFTEMTKIEGLGTRKAKILYQKLGIKTVKELEKATRAHKIAPLFGFGKKTEENILQGIEFLKVDKGRVLLGFIMPTVKQIVLKLENLKEVKKTSIAGSTRRMKETIGDVDILVASDEPEKINDFFVKLPGIEKVWAKGPTKSSVHLKQGFDVDLRVVKEESFGSALQYFTGSKEHNIATRKIAISKGLKLNEYGVFKGAKQIAGKTEEEVYKAIGLLYIEPEMREDGGEIQLALENKLPKLIGYKDIKGDLHCHSDWDGGENSIEEMAKYAINVGYEYIGISDHTKFLHIENGLNKEQLLKQHEAINKLNLKFKNKNVKFRILHGCETNILNDGSVDIKDEVLEKMDYVIAGVHSSLKMPRKEMTERIIKAMNNKNIDIISHPTGRLILKRDEYQVDLEKMLKIAKETGTILEINSWPERLDLKDIYIKMAKRIGVKMIVNTDSHQKDQMRFMEFGVAQARRGWAEKSDIINTNSVEELLKYIKK
ncbi:MAG: DNA polymerase III [Candidatus Staskawiczbacteria bacterium RIFOXYD1_FULL_39_28]|nr:MAG: DNA polymerase III [Candidatus Staskawiczbacteria bacterium RIFOXYD1_FULL_39_28]